MKLKLHKHSTAVCILHREAAQEKFFSVENYIKCILFMTHSVTNSTHYSNCLLYRKISCIVIPTNNTPSIPNKYKHFTVSADTVTFLTTVHSVLLVLTVLHSANHNSDLCTITLISIIYIYINNQLFTNDYGKTVHMVTQSLKSKTNPIQPTTKFTMTAVSSFSFFCNKEH